MNHVLFQKSEVRWEQRSSQALWPRSDLLIERDLWDWQDNSAGKTFAAKMDNVSSIPRTHMVEGKNCPPQAVFQPNTHSVKAVRRKKNLLT